MSHTCQGVTAAAQHFTVPPGIRSTAGHYRSVFPATVDKGAAELAHGCGALDAVVAVRVVAGDAAEFVAGELGVCASCAVACSLVAPRGSGPRSSMWVRIIHPCWSGGRSILVEGTGEPVPSADIEARDPLRIGDRFG